MALDPAHSVRVSARPTERFVAEYDSDLWCQRFELYLAEAEIRATKYTTELLSLLDNESFQVACQLGLVGVEQSYEAVKTALQQHLSPAGNELE